MNDGRVELENVKKMARLRILRVYDEMFKLDIEENEESLR